MWWKKASTGLALAAAAVLTISTNAALGQDIVRIASPYKTTVLDPVRSAAAGNIETYGQLYARVLRRESDGSLAPGLAESWEVSSDGKTITAHLRDAKFSDGSPITAEDVVFSLVRVRDHEESAYPAPMQQLDEAIAKDEKTVVLKLTNPFAPFLGNLEVFNAGIISKKDVERRGEEGAFAGDPVTSGPYKVKEWRPNDRLIIEPNPHYWRAGYPKNAGAELIEVTDQNTRVSMILAGDVDAVREVPWSQVSDLQQADDVVMPLESSTQVFITLLNHKKPPFDDVRVRQAAAHALDRAALTKAITHGHGHTANTTLPGALDFHFSEFPGISYDPQKAKSLLSDADASGAEVVVVIPANPEREQLAVLMQAQWAAVGLNAKIEKVDGGTWWTRIPEGDYNAAPTWYYNETTDPDLAVRWALCGTCGNRSYYTNYDNPKINDLVEAGATALDEGERAAIYREIQETTTTEVSQIPLYYPPYSNAYRTRISGLIMTPALQWTLEETEVVE